MAAVGVNGGATSVAFGAASVLLALQGGAQLSLLRARGWAACEQQEGMHAARASRKCALNVLSRRRVART